MTHRGIVVLAAFSFLAFTVVGRSVGVNAVLVQEKAAPSVIGNWQGMFVRGEANLRVIIHIQAGAEGKLSATLDSPDQGGAAGIPLDAVALSGGSFHFEYSAAHISFTGLLSSEGAEIIGIWQQGGPVGFVLTRQDATFPAVLALKRGSVTLEPCAIPTLTRQARCGKYEVFEDRAGHAGRKLAINLLLLPATGPTTVSDPVFFIAGGPGQGSVDVIKSGDVLAPLHRNRDLVFVDQRGTGGSNPLRCTPPGDPKLVGTYLAERFEPELLKQCRTELEKRANLTFYTTTIAMDDLDEIRNAMGYDKINLLGGSYGTTAAMSYLRQHPDHVRTVALKGVAPVEAKLPLPFARGVEHALDQMFSRCQADDACKKAFPDLRNDLTAVLQRFAAGPITVKALSPFTGRPENVTLSRDLVMENIRLLLYSPGGVSLLPLMIHEMQGGDFSTFSVYAFQQMQHLSASIALGMHLSVICAEDVPFVTDAAATALMKGTTYGDSRVAVYRRACDLWPRAAVPATFNTPVRSVLPVLMISGDADPVTPPTLGAEALKTLANGRQLVIPNGTHLTEDECLYQLIGQFFDEGSAKNLDLACVNGIKWVPFLTGK